MVSSQQSACACRRNNFWGPASFDAANAMVDRSVIAEPCLLQLHPSTGKVLAAIGARSFAMPHGLHIDWWGNLWVADAGLQLVMKLDKQGQVLWSEGLPFKPGEIRRFCKPTGIASLPNGDVFISDGYCNSRVLRARWTQGVPAV